MECASQSGSDHAEFRNAMPHKAAQKLFPASRDVQSDLASILLRSLPPEQTALFHTVNQLNCAVMTNLEPLRQGLNCGRLTEGDPPQRQQTDVLLRFQPDGPGCHLALLEIAPD
jgi:hypothetical protein